MIATKKTSKQPQIAKFVGPTWGPPGSCRPRWAPCWPHKPCYQGRTTDHYWESTCEQWIPHTKASTVMLKVFPRHDITMTATLIIMTSSNGNIFNVTGHLCGEFTGDFRVTGPFVRGIHRSLVNSPHKGQWRGTKRLSKQSWGWWFETLSRPLWRNCNEIWVNKLHLSAKAIT